MLLLDGLAWAYESEAQPVRLADEVELFSSAEFTTGRLPADSPVQVEFRVEANGGAGVGMDGEGALTWPDALTLLFTGEPGSGILVLDASLDAVTEVTIDLSDYGYEGTFEIDRRSLAMDAGTFSIPSSWTAATRTASTWSTRWARCRSSRTATRSSTSCT